MKLALNISVSRCSMASSVPFHSYLRTDLPNWFVPMAVPVDNVLCGKENALFAYSVSMPCGVRSLHVSKNRRSLAVRPCLWLSFCKMIRSLPTSMPPVCMKSVSGKRKAVMIWA